MFALLDRFRKASTQVACLDCRLFHDLPLDFDQGLASIQGFRERHRGHRVQFLRERVRRRSQVEELAWLANSDIKQALQAVQTMTVTNLQSLASSPTAGWQSASVDNTSNLFLDAWLQAVLTTANTAPANSKGMYIFAYGSINGTDFSNPVTGSEGTLTLVDVTTTPQNLRQIGFMPYTTQNETIESSPMSVAAGFGGVLPPYWGVALINHSGAALSTSCTMKYRGVYTTVI